MKTTTATEISSTALRLLLLLWIGGLAGPLAAQTQPLTIDGNGMVGIGTTKPGRLLEIRKDSAAALGPILLLQNSGGGGGAGCAIEFNGYDPLGKAPSFRIQSMDDGRFSSHLAFYSKEPGSNEGGLLERMRIAANGNVGIGEADPKAKLVVKGRIQDATGWLVPVGTIVAYGGTTEPDGWTVCDGRAIGEPKYAELRSVLSSNNTPNLQGRFVVGTGIYNEPNFSQTYARGNTGGEAKHQLSIPEMPSHTHAYDASETHDSNNGWVGDATKGARRVKISDRAGELRTNDAIRSTGGNQAHENRPPYYGLMYIIKY